MSPFVRLALALERFRSSAIELTGLVLVWAGIDQIYAPAALVFAGAALVFIAQGLERDR